MLPRFLFPILVYRSFFFPFLVLSLIVAPCWLLLRVYLRRTPSHRPSLQREMVLFTFVVYLCGLAVATLSPSHPSRLVAESTVAIDLRPSLASLTCLSASLPEGSTAHSFCVRNARGNLILFLPLGILIPLVWTRLRFWSGLRVGIAVSISIELVQLLSRVWGSYRTADINDVILNSLGACLGLALVSLLRLRRGTHPT
jgi:glycopeptide antibiotics resistance protein